jgi:hypothetical protein
VRRRALALLVAGATLVGACGEEAPPPAAPPPALPAPADGVSRAALSARLDHALEDHDLEAALGALDLLQRHHEGRSETSRGEERAPEATLGAVFDAALADARRAIDGPAPDRPRAERALSIARDLAPGVRDQASFKASAAARRWVGLTALTDLKTPLASHPGPRVLVVGDDYDLAEAYLLAALIRWLAWGSRDGLRVGVLPMHHGFVRMGTRRTPADGREEERGSLERRLAATAPGAVLEPEPPDAAVAAADLGLLGMDSAVLVLDRTGRIVARLSGRNLDPSALDVVVQKVLSR